MPQADKGMGRIVLRRMTPDDIPFGMELKSHAGWNQVEADWKMLLEAGGDSFVACLDGRNAGTVISIPYQDQFTWIGMVLVDPGAKRKGIGKALLNRSIEIARKKGAIRLDATAEGYELYTRLGFRTEYELVRMVKKSNGSGTRQHPGRGQHILRIGKDQLGSVFSMDRPIFGADRSGILRSLQERNPEYACCILEKGSIKAYCLGRSGSQYEHIGPVIAEDFSHAAGLMERLLVQLKAKDLVIDAFADKPDWILLLEGYGFTRQRSLTRMCLGTLPHPGITEKQFAITGPETG
jgi:GNAT superfamily N-acetyltransferase